jgi:hypothetical protein
VPEFLSQNESNIRHLAFEVAPSETYPIFDPQKELTADDWQSMDAWVCAEMESRGTRLDFSAIRLAADLKYLSRDQEQTEPIEKIVDQYWDTIHRDLESMKADSATATSAYGNFAQYIRHALPTAVLFPDRFAAFRSDADYWRLHRRRLHMLKEDRELIFYAEAAKWVAIVKPDTPIEIDRSDAYRQNLLERYRSILTMDHLKDMIYPLDLAIDIRLLFPKITRDALLTPKQWQTSWDTLARLRDEKRWQVFSGLASSLELLSYDNWEIRDFMVRPIKTVKIDREGKQDLPETRQF